MNKHIITIVLLLLLITPSICMAEYGRGTWYEDKLYDVYIKDHKTYFHLKIERVVTYPSATLFIFSESDGVDIVVPSTSIKKMIDVTLKGGH